MKFTLIRNATVKLEYGGTTFLIDPWLAEQGEDGIYGKGKLAGYYPAFAEEVCVAMPRVDLPMSREEVLAGVDQYLITHLHPDHIDIADDLTFGRYLDHEVPILAQDANEADALRNSGFAKVACPGEDDTFEIGDVTIHRVDAIHGTIKACGKASGFVFTCSREPTIYFIGDSVWTDCVRESIERFQPDYIVANACSAQLLEYGRLIMNDEDVYYVHQTRPEATVILDHLDTIAHLGLHRSDLKRRMVGYHIEDKVLIPDDGDSYKFEL